MSTPPRKMPSTHKTSTQVTDDPDTLYRVRDKDYAVAKGQISPGVWGDNLTREAAEKLKNQVVTSNKSRTARVEAMEVVKPDDGTLQVAQQRAADAAKRAAEDARRRTAAERVPANHRQATPISALPQKPAPVAAPPVAPVAPPTAPMPAPEDSEASALLDGDGAETAIEPGADTEGDDGIDDAALGDLLDGGDSMSDEEVARGVSRANDEQREESRKVRIGDIVLFHRMETPTAVDGQPAAKPRLATVLARVVGAQINPEQPPLITVHPEVTPDMLELKDGKMKIKADAKPTEEPVVGVPFALAEEATDRTWSLVL